MASADVSASPISEAESGSSGEYVLKKLFAEFVVVSERKLQHITSQPLEYSLAKALQKGEDAQFDQLLSALNEVSSFCLRSVLTAIFKWRDMQIDQSRNSGSWSVVPSSDVTDSPSPASKREKEYLTERRELAVEFLFCLVLAEVLTRLSVHPVPESFIHTIEDLAFRHFKQQESIKDRTNSNPNVPNMKKIADLYAEVIGVLSQARFHSVRRRFFLEIRNPAHSSATIISIIEGMSFIRVKMFPVEELEQWFAFLQECATFFLECPREKIKFAMSSLLVEILLPVAAVISLEASLPVARKLVSMLYGHCVEHARRARHSNTYIPLATVLLAISEQSFFLNTWHSFLVQNLLPSLRRGDSKVQLIALVSLYRLVWVYMVRIKGESNMMTMSRLRLVLETLFPRGQRGVQPKDMPLNYFVKLIQFIARERLEYVMQDVVLELLSQGRAKTAINPERMIIGLRAFLMITDSLEKEEGDPPMPLNTGPLPSGGASRVKTRFLSNTLSSKTAKKIGIAQFYSSVCRALDGILRSLDHSVGHFLISTSPPVGKSVEEVLSGVKPKLDLLRTCVAAIPRILPEGMSREYLIDLLSRLTIHLDHELTRAAANSLHTMVTNFPAWRHDIVRVFVQFLLRDVPDSCPLVLEAALKALIQFISHWRMLITSPDSEKPPGVTSPPPSSSADLEEVGVYCVPWVEACALVTLCSYRSVTRRLSLVLLREVRSLHEALTGERNRIEEMPVMDVVDSVTPVIIKRYLATISVKERTELRVANQSLNLNWLADRAACFLEHGGNRESLRDPWALCLAGLMEPHLLPKECPTAIKLAWPNFYHRMQKAYNILDPSGMVSDRGERPSSIRGRQRPIISSVETFLWRNYLIFASCSAPPSGSLSFSSSSDSSMLESSGGRSFNLTARELYHRTVPLIRWDGEIREVAVTALGLVHPLAFSDLVDQLQQAMHDALEQRRDVKRKRRRDVLKIQITRVLALAAEHGCFHHSQMARTERGEISPVLLEFIDGIKNYLDAEKEGVQSYPELRLHFAGLIANVINSVPRGQGRVLLFTPVSRQSLFYLFANWCGLFGQRVDVDVRSRNPQLSYNSLQAMSALLCCGPVFQANGLDKSSAIYRWLDNMLNCGEARVQTLGRKTVQLLLHNNRSTPTLLHWVIDRCYDSKAAAAQLCFHALSNTIASFPDYPCDMVTLLHVVLFKTGDSEHSTRERATQLLQLLDRRFLAENGYTRPELWGCLTGGAYSQCHVTFSRELATTNPELTFPLFCEMVYRFEMAPRSGQRNILQYMVPWLRNVELVEDSPHSPYLSHASGPVPWQGPTCSILQGSGWGSVEGTKVVLHNLLYITAKYGEEHVKEVENLWCALCTWQCNIRIALNYLARLTCVSGNVALMMQQAKRIAVCFSRSKAKPIVTELIKDLKLVEMISADLQPSDSPPFYSLVAVGHASQFTDVKDEDDSWAMAWRASVRLKEGRPVALPTPPSKQYYASLRLLLKLPARQLAPLHRCNFALIVLSELVIELRLEVDWSPHLPLLLHVALLGLDLFRPLVYEHSKALLGNLVIVLACKDDKMAALQARYVQQEAMLCSPTPSSPVVVEGEEDEEGDQLLRQSSMESLLDPAHYNTSLLEDARELIKFIAQRDGHRPRWPFADISSRLNPSGDVPDLSKLVGMVIQVFSHVFPEELKEKWARIALHWATGCSSHQYASQSFQVCRALQLPLSPSMFREILTRLAESASDTNEDMQSYVLEIVLTLECALGHLPEESPGTPHSESKENSRKISDLPPLPSEIPETPSSLSPPPSADSGAGVRSRHCRVRSITSKSEMVPQWPSTAKAHIESPPQTLPTVITPQPTSPPSSLHNPSPPSQSTPLYSHPLPTIASTENIDSPTLGTGGAAGGGEREEGKGKAQSSVESGSEGGGEAGRGGDGEEGEGEERGGGRAGYKKLIPFSVAADHLLQPGSLSSSPQKATVEHFHAFSDITGLSSSGEYQLEETDDSRARKGSEPPPSLMALFEHDFASSRRVMKQKSVEEGGAVAHPKQRSFDNSHLNAPNLPGSPKHHRRMKSPSTSEKGRERGQSKIKRAPSHPHLHQTNSNPHPLSTQPLTKARSIQQLRMESSDSDDSRKQRSYSGGREDMRLMKPHPLRSLAREGRVQEGVKKTPSRESLNSRVKEEDNPKITSSVGSPKEAHEKERSVREVGLRQVSVDSVLTPPAHLATSPSKSYSDMRRRNSTQIGLRKDILNSGGGRGRPHSMVETSSLRPQHSVEFNPTPSDLVAQMFWTAVSLLHSDFEAEFFMALRLISKCLERMNLSAPDTRDRLERLLLKFKWPNFPGVQALLLKGLTLDSVADTTRSLLSHITPYSTQRVFDSSQYAGLPLNIIALMPVLVHHFSGPTAFCQRAVVNIRQACDSVELSSLECKTKLQHMSKMFQMYSAGEFTNSCDIWLAGICRYLNEAYCSLAPEILQLLTAMLDEGPSLYHRAVLRLLYEYLRLQEPKAPKMHALINSITAVVHRHLKGSLWREAVDLLKLTVSNSAALVQPPTRGLPVVDLGLFNQTLPGPTLQFSMDLKSNSSDLSLAQEEPLQPRWKNPAGSQRNTRQWLLSVIKACVPIPVLMSSPSVVFADEQALMDKATVHSSASDEASGSITSVQGDMSSQPEAQSLISVEFNFLDNMEYIYDSSSESETPPGPFSRPEGEEGAEEEEEEEEEEESLSEPEAVTGEMELIPGELEEEVTAMSGGALEPDQFVVSGKREEALLQEEEPLPSQPISYDLHSPGRRLIAVHHHESSHASTLTEGSHESHDTSLESHGTSVESRDLREPSLEEGGDGRKEEEWEKQTDVVGEVVEGDKKGAEGEDGTSKDVDERAGEDREDRSSSEKGGEEGEGAEKQEGEEEGPKRIIEFGEVVEEEEEEMEEGEEASVEKEEAEEGIGVEKMEGNRTERRDGEENGAEMKEEAEKEEKKVAKEGEQQGEDTGEVAFLETGGLEEYPIEPCERDKREVVGGVAETMEAAYTAEVPEDEPPPALESVAVSQPALDAGQGDVVAGGEDQVAEVAGGEDQVAEVAGGEDQVVGGEDQVAGTEGEVCGAKSIPEEPGHAEVSQAQPKDGPREDELLEHPGTLERSDSQGSIQDTIQDIPQDTNLESSQDTGQENNQNNVQDTSRESSQDTGQENSQNTVQDANLESGQDTSQENSRNNIQDTSGDSSRDTVQDSGQENSQDNVQDTSRESSQDTGQEKSQDNVQDNDQGGTWDTGQESVQDTPQETSEVFQGSNLQNAAQDTGQGGSTEDTATAQKCSDPEEFDGVGEMDMDQIEGGHQQREEVEEAGGERGEEDEKPMELDSVESSDAKPPPAATSARDLGQVVERRVETSHFINVSNEEIGEVWRQHVASIGRDKTGALAVHTYYLFGRLFLVLRHQFSMLTREACNYLGETYHSVASHFLVTVELLLSQLELPKVYVDSELLAQTRLVDSHVFLTLEIDGNLETYHDRRRTVLERLGHIKLQLRQQSLERKRTLEQPPPEALELQSLTPEQATLKLCQAVHRLHFQLLVLLGSYVKLLHTLQPHLEHSGGLETSLELTETKQNLEESLEALGRVPTPPLDEQTEQEVYKMEVQEVVGALEDTLSQKQWSRAIQLLRSARKHCRGVEQFGSGEEDDLDCLFYIYARYLTERQEGVLCITRLQCELSDIHSKLMAQNVSLHALLEHTHLELCHSAREEALERRV